MNRVNPVLVLGLLFLAGLFFTSCEKSEPDIQELDTYQLPSKDFSASKRNGKLVDAQPLPELYNQTPLEQLGMPEITEELGLALQHQLRVLEKGNYKDGESLGNLELTYAEMKDVIELLLDRKGSQPDDLHHYLEAHQVRGKDRKGSVYFTGYYPPVLKVRKSPTEKYRYPIYAYPKDWEGPLPSRAEIDGEGHLEGLGLELAYASNALDVYVMQLQGSGYVEYLDTGERYLFRYAGDNGRRYRNIQRFLKERKYLGVADLSFSNIRRYLIQNPEMQDSVLFSDRSYTFFNPEKGLVKGAAEVPLMNMISIAADPDYFPKGSVLLAAMPVVEKGAVTHHEYTILLPQDVGGAIRGTGHVDVYCGVGEAGKNRASYLHQYGRMWLLKPKPDASVAEKLDAEMQRDNL
jgi:membrane-bound lytic murein transglycosylase A